MPMLVTEFDEVPDKYQNDTGELMSGSISWQGYSLAHLKESRMMPEIDCKPFSRNDAGRWVASRWVGTINANGIEWRIQPRIGKERFAFLARSVLSAAVMRGASQTIAGQRDQLDLLPTAWVVAFQNASRRHGLPKAYVRREARDCLELRGELDVERQIVDNLIERQFLACRWDDLTQDNPINQASYLTIGHLRRHRRFPYAQGKNPLSVELEHWRERFPLLGVGQANGFPPDKNIRWSRANDGFRMPHRLAKWVVENRGEAGGKSSAPAILVDSAEVWELYLRERLKNVVDELNFGLELVWPRSDRMDYLLDWEGRAVKGLIPDFSIVRSSDGEVVAVLDAKYRGFKPPTEDPEIAVQMAFYSATINHQNGRSSGKLPFTALIYPKCPGLNVHLPTGVFGEGWFRMANRPALQTWCVELGDPKNEDEFHKNVEKQLEEMVMTGLLYI
ncbi:5-methylcytosine-specific restriction enzyme subunit McrC [Gammaproteobacteria bacterium]